MVIFFSIFYAVDSFVLFLWRLFWYNRTKNFDKDINIDLFWQKYKIELRQWKAFDNILF